MTSTANMIAAFCPVHVFLHLDVNLWRRIWMHVSICWCLSICYPTLQWTWFGLFLMGRWQNLSPVCLQDCIHAWRQKAEMKHMRKLWRLALNQSMKGRRANFLGLFRTTKDLLAFLQKYMQWSRNSSFPCFICFRTNNSTTGLGKKFQSFVISPHVTRREMLSSSKPQNYEVQSRKSVCIFWRVVCECFFWFLVVDKECVCFWFLVVEKDGTSWTRMGRTWK